MGNHLGAVEPARLVVQFIAFVPPEIGNVVLAQNTIDVARRPEFDERNVRTLLAQQQGDFEVRLTEKNTTSVLFADTNEILANK
jgi:hypothetical protein